MEYLVDGGKSGDSLSLDMSSREAFRLRGLLRTWERAFLANVEQVRSTPLRTSQCTEGKTVGFVQLRESRFVVLWGCF